jgi:DNA-binding CsgD family transcriptional regulator
MLQGEPKRPATTGSSPPESVEDLIRKLIRKASGSALDLHESSGAILKVQLDGRQYTLICSGSEFSCHLSPREREIVRLVAQGLPNKCISAVLEISTWTVATHLRRIFGKLRVTSRAAMIARLLEQGNIGDLPDVASLTPSSNSASPRVPRK